MASSKEFADARAVLVLPGHTHSESVETREREPFLQGGRSANRVVGRQVQAPDLFLGDGNAICGAIGLLENPSQADLRPLRAHHRAAAFVAGAARIRVDALDRARSHWLVSGFRGRVMMAGRSTLHADSQRLSRAVFMLHWR